MGNNFYFIGKVVAAISALVGAGYLGSLGQQRLGTPVVQSAVVPVCNTAGCGSGVLLDVEFVLTTHHGTKQGPITVAGYQAQVIASDPENDLALLWVQGLKGPTFKVASPNDDVTGTVVVYGYPRGTYSAVRCSLDEKGNLSDCVMAGACGGPALKDGRVVMIVNRYHGGATATQLRTFLTKAGYSRLIHTN